VEFHSSLFVNHELRITNYEFLTASFQTKVNHPENFDIKERDPHKGTSVISKELASIFPILVLQISLKLLILKRD